MLKISLTSLSRGIQIPCGTSVCAFYFTVVLFRILIPSLTPHSPASHTLTSLVSH